MSVSVLFQSSNGGASYVDPISYGNTSNGSITASQVIFLSHNGANPITACGLYVDLASPYSGSFTAAADKAEILGWGDAGSSGTFGGYEINMNATGSFPSPSWPTFTNKTTVDGHGFTIRTGVGDSSGNAITMQTVTRATSSGTIQTGASPNVSISTRVVVPASVTLLGARQLRLILQYTYTS